MSSFLPVGYFIASFRLSIYRSFLVDSVRKMITYQAKGWGGGGEYDFAKRAKDQ